MFNKWQMEGYIKLENRMNHKRLPRSVMNFHNEVNCRNYEKLSTPSFVYSCLKVVVVFLVTAVLTSIGILIFGITK